MEGGSCMLLGVLDEKWNHLLRKEDGDVWIA